MKVNVTQIVREEGTTASFELEEKFPSVQFGTDSFSFQSPVHVQLRVTNTGKSLFVQGIIKTELMAMCGRCLEEFSYPLDLEYEDEWVQSSKATSEQIDTALLFEKEEIEIGERILEQIVLALPMKFICSPECRGLCPTCGTNLNTGKCHCSETRIDPRMAELAKWQSGD